MEAMTNDNDDKSQIGVELTASWVVFSLIVFATGNFHVMEVIVCVAVLFYTLWVNFQVFGHPQRPA